MPASLPLSEPLCDRIHATCSCRDGNPCIRYCACQYQGKASKRCMSQVHALAAEAERMQDDLANASEYGEIMRAKIEALTAKVEASHVQGCECVRWDMILEDGKRSYGREDPRCIAWRKS